MKNIILVFCAGLLLSGCASFGTHHDKTSTPTQYLDKHQPRAKPAPARHKGKAVKKPAKATADDPYECFGAGRYDAMAKGRTCFEDTPTTTTKPVAEKLKKKGWWTRLKERLRPKKKEKVNGISYP